MREEQRLSSHEIERRLLAALCAATLDRKTRAQILKRLSAHTFANPDHEIIFQALRKMPPRATGRQIRETLSSRLTLLGFPDIDVEPIFELSPPSSDTITQLLQQLDR
jgi:DnaB-like helicase N terminal domain